MSMQNLSRTLLAVGLIVVSPATTLAQAPTCDAPAYSAFDFWVGEWEVRTPDGALAGLNTIRKTAGGCALKEDWRGAAGSRGESVNFVDPSTGAWNQVWVDDSGLVLRLEGGVSEPGMVLEGTGRDPSFRHRITWSPLGDGRVLQHWERSENDGGTWTDVFEGYYSRLPAVPDSVERSIGCHSPQGRAFDFWAGEWVVESRLLTSEGWHDSEGYWKAEPALSGCGFLDYTTGDFGQGVMSGVGSRFYDPETDLWSITWVSTLGPGTPSVWVGRLDEDGKGSFIRETGATDGPARTRIRWNVQTPDHATWDFSVERAADGEWQTLWEMEFRRLGSETPDQ